MSKYKKLLIATHNPGKLNEYRALLKDTFFELLSLKDLRIKGEPEETGKDFQENALIKLNFYSRLTDLPTLAEDSGLEIDFLNGEPGVLSRRWPGYAATDQELVDLALSKLKDVPWEKRGAQFRVVVAFKKSATSDIKFGEGILRGYITDKLGASIIPGFPYRSIFYLGQIKNVLASLSVEQEAKLAGHRKMALEALKPYFMD